MSFDEEHLRRHNRKMSAIALIHDYFNHQTDDAPLTKPELQGLLIAVVEHLG